MFGLVRYIAVFIFIIFITAGCDYDREDNGIVDHSAELTRGWQEYKAGNYKLAILAFEKALGDDAAVDIVSDSYNGLGWSYMSVSQNMNINMTNLNIAVVKFRKAIEKDASNYDAMIGLATTLLIRQSSDNDCKESLKIIEMAIDKDSRYMYRHDYNSEADLYALKAQCYYYLGEFENAKSEVDKALAKDANNRTALLMKKILF